MTARFQDGVLEKGQRQEMGSGSRFFIYVTLLFNEVRFQPAYYKVMQDWKVKMSWETL